MEIREIMELERRKAIIKAMAELEIALSTFYNNDTHMAGLEYIYEQLQEYKKGYL